MSTTSKFNPMPDDAYGVCRTCDIDLATEQVANIHMNATMAEAMAKGENGSHAVRVLNPSRESRIESEVDELIDEVTSDLMSKIEDLVYRNHITEDEAKMALRHHSDLADAWEEHCDE